MFLRFTFLFFYLKHLVEVENIASCESLNVVIITCGGKVTHKKKRQNSSITEKPLLLSAKWCR